MASTFSDYGVQPFGLPALKGVCFSENGEILDSSDSDNDENDLPSVSEIVAGVRRAPVQTRPAGPAIDLTCDTDDDDTESDLFTQPIPGLQFVNPPSEHRQPRRQCNLQVSDLTTWRTKSCECGWMQRGYFVHHMDPDQLFEDEDTHGDTAYSERPTNSSSCCQCAIATVLSSQGSVRPGAWDRIWASTANTAK